MCAGISHAKGKYFSWALLYEKSPRSLVSKGELTCTCIKNVSYATHSIFYGSQVHTWFLFLFVWKIKNKIFLSAVLLLSNIFQGFLGQMDNIICFLANVVFHIGHYTQAKRLMAVRECSRTFTMLKWHILYISTILAMKVHDLKSANLPHLGSWTFTVKIVEIYRMCRFNIMNIHEHSQTAINYFAWVWGHTYVQL